MKRKKNQSMPAEWTPQSLGLAPDLYAAALDYLFERPIPSRQGQEWYWSLDEEPFEATHLEWTRIQTVLFANAGRDLARFEDEQVGMGLDYVMSNSVSNVAFAAIDPSVSIGEAMQMMKAMPMLWRDCIGPRLASASGPIGSAAGGRLGVVCYMWFDVWPTFCNVRDQPPWRDALWHVFKEMLNVPCRAVQVSALHGIGHNVNYLGLDQEVSRTISVFVRGLGNDEELKNYADAARRGLVQ